MERTIRIAAVGLAAWTLTAMIAGCGRSEPNPNGSGAGFGISKPSGGKTAQSDVIEINGSVLSEAEVKALTKLYNGGRVPPGRYWYDRVSGLWGVMGGPPAGCTLPGLGLPGPMPANASGGTSGIFINGRELTGGEAAELEYLNGGPILLSRWRIDFQGYVGPEGYAPTTTLAQLTANAARRAGGGGGGRKLSIWRTGELVGMEPFGSGWIRH